jgi:hypothetical protein
MAEHNTTYYLNINGVNEWKTKKDPWVLGRMGEFWKNLSIQILQGQMWYCELGNAYER